MNAQPFLRGYTYEIAKRHWRNKNKIFPGSTWPISTKLELKHFWVMRTCSKEGPRHFPRGDNYEKAKIYWRNLKIVFSRSTGTISTKLSTIHPWVKEIQVCSNEGRELIWTVFSSERCGPWPSYFLFSLYLKICALSKYKQGTQQWKKNIHIFFRLQSVC